MPHSSGGGSHGGGSHGGHHSSGSHGGSGSYNRVGNKPFSGASTYYYYRNSRPVYVYANYDITEQPSKSRFKGLYVFIPVLLFEFIILLSAFSPPKKLDLDYSDRNIYIIDNAAVLDGQTYLRTVLTEFYDKTGITPAVVTVNNEEWEHRYIDLEAYAYELYVNMFDDEKHWLIVYSEDRFPSDKWIDWYWEGMQGDETDSILNYAVISEFNDNLQKYLLQNQKHSVGEAISMAFSDIMPVVMAPYTDWELVMGVGFFIFYTLVCMYSVIFYNPNKKYAGAKRYINNGEKNATPVEYTCDYCGGIYIAGTCTSCPHCGAGVKPLESERYN